MSTSIRPEQPRDRRASPTQPIQGAADLWDAKVRDGMSPERATAYVTEVYGPPPTRAQPRRSRPSAAAPAAARSTFSPQSTAASPTEIDDRKLLADALSPAESVAAIGSTLASGASFGLFDDLADRFSEGEGETQRYLQKQLRRDHPAVSVGAELAGAFAVPGSVFKAAPRSASFLRKAGTMLAEGAAQGGVAGAGNAEGSFRTREGLASRARGAVHGAAAGAATAGFVGGAASAGEHGFQRLGEMTGLTAPPLRDLLTGRTSRADVAAGRARLSTLASRGLGDETTVADVLPQGEGALRQAATSNRSVRKTVDTELRSRSNRLATAADDRLSAVTGTQRRSVRRTVADLRTEAQTKAEPLYKSAEEEASQFDVANPPPAPRKASALVDAQGNPLRTPEEPANPVRAQLEQATALPYVRQRIAQLKADPRSTFAKSRDDDHALLDQVYKDVGDRIRGLGDKAQKSGLNDAERSLYEDLIGQRTTLRDAMVARAPSYGTALSTYAGDAASWRAFEQGNRTAKLPADAIPSELAKVDAAEQPFFKEGAAQALRSQDVPTPELGEHARFSDVLKPIATRERADRFKALYGEDTFREYLRDLVEMAGLQRMRAGGGESTTTDKLIEQMTADPDAILGLFRSMFKGDAIGAISQAGRATRPLDRLRNSKAGKENADFLLRRGEQDVSAALDEIDALHAAAEESRRIGLRDRGRGRGRNAAAREAGAVTGSQEVPKKR